MRKTALFSYSIWILIITLYFPTFWKLYHARWENIDYTHAYFILPLSLWLVWRKRNELKEYVQQNHQGKSFYSLLLFLFGILLFIFGWRQDYLFISTLSLIPLLIGVIGYIYGTTVVKMFYFPIFYLLLLVPPPLGVIDSITLPMRYGISAVAEVILKLLEFPIKRDGLLLTVGYFDIFMGEPCSGFRSLITMFSLILVYVYVIKSTIVKKLFLTSLITPLALFGNLVRVIALCLITFYFGEEAGQGFFHNFSGIVIFVITLSGLMAIDSFTDKLKIFKVKVNN